MSDGELDTQADRVVAQPEPLTPPDPRFRRLLRQTGAVKAATLLILASIAELVLPGFTGVFWVPAVFAGGLFILWLPGRIWRAAGHHEGPHDLRVVRGVWTRFDATVPYTRVQHLDVSQGALERGNGLATLSLHTAGTGNATVALEGLAHAEALALRDRVRDRLRALEQAGAGQ